MFDNSVTGNENAITLLFIIGLVGFLLLISNAVIIIALIIRISHLTEIQKQIKSEAHNIMSALEKLHNAVSDNATAVSEGFTALDSAMQELSSDIQSLPGASDVQAEADRLTSNTDAIRTAAAQMAQAIRDALPTDTRLDVPPVDDTTDNG
jgi:methyl-accepting chemotaxis protein